MTFKIPNALMILFNHNEGFTTEELIHVLQTDKETQEFLKNLKPVIMEYLKSEFPSLSVLNIF